MHARTHAASITIVGMRSCPIFMLLITFPRTLLKGLKGRQFAGEEITKMNADCVGTWSVGLGEKSKVKIKTRPVGIG